MFRRIFVFIEYFPFVFFRLSFQASFSLIFYKKESAKFPEAPCALQNRSNVAVTFAKLTGLWLSD